MDESLIFVSIVGTQALGTLEPYLALAASLKPMPVRLLYTVMTEELAQRLAQYIQARFPVDVELIETGFSPAGEKSAPRLISAMAEEAQANGQRICLNLDGGLNYLIAATVIGLEKYQPLYIQAPRDRAVLTDAREESHRALRLPDPLGPAEILDLQGVAHVSGLKKNPGENPRLPLDEILRREKIPLPSSFLKIVQIGDMVFDYVWNPGNNRLSFLKDWRFELADKAERRLREWDFAQWSKDRARCGHLYDRRIYALAWSKQSQERLREDSANQIEVILYEQDGEGRAPGRSGAGDRLQAIFGEKRQKVRERQLEAPAPAELPHLKDESLVVCLGRDLPGTILAICTHRPKHLVLACDARSSDLVRDYAERIRANAKKLGVESVHLATGFRLEGVFADQALPAAGPGKARVAVNISPGTKGQGAMLARWALRHGFEIWSLNGREQLSSPLLAPAGTQALPFQTCDPALMLRLQGRELEDEGSPESALAPNFEWLDALLAFMRQADDAGRDFGEAFARGQMKVGKNELKKTGRDKWQLRLDGACHQFIREGKGKWFEQLCARALMNAGARHVRLNVRLAWSEAIRRDIKNRLNLKEEPVRGERDVLGAWRGNFVLLSAKSYPLEDEPNPETGLTLAGAIEEARNTGASLDKFTLSLVTHMGSSKKSGDDRVALITWRELCRPEALAQQIDSLAFSQSTTRQEA